MDAAAAELERAVDLRQTFDAAESPWLAQARIGLAHVRAAQGRLPQAQTLLKQARLSLAHQPRLAVSFRDTALASTVR